MAVNPIKVWNGTAWEYTGPAVAAPPVKYQATAPTSPATGDVWVESDYDVASVDPSKLLTGGVYTNESTRSAAIPTPTTGMVTYVGDTGTDSSTIPQLETYTGSAWQTPYGSTLIGRATFSGAATFSMDNVFSATYDNYIIHVTNVVPAIFGNLDFRLRVAGTDNSSNNYTAGRVYVGAFGSTALGSTNNSTAAAFTAVQITTGIDNSHATITVTNPFNAVKTGFTSVGAGNLLDVNGGNMTVTTSYTGFTFLNSSGGNIAGTVRVYGLRNS
jgi:hypothetical protein